MSKKVLCCHSEDVVTMYKSGMSTSDIAKETGKSLSTIYLWLKKAGVDYRGNVPVLEQHHEAIQRDIYDGYTIAAVAKKYRCNLSTTRLYIRQHIDYPEEACASDLQLEKVGSLKNVGVSMPPVNFDNEKNHWDRRRGSSFVCHMLDNHICIHI